MISCTEWPLYRIFGRYSIIDMTVTPCTERGQKSPPVGRTVGTEQYNHWAEPSTPRQKNHHLSAEPLAPSNITIGPSHRHRGKKSPHLGQAVGTEQYNQYSIDITYYPNTHTLGPIRQHWLQQHNRPTRQKHLQYSMGPSSDGPSDTEHCQPQLSVRDGLIH